MVAFRLRAPTGSGSGSALPNQLPRVGAGGAEGAMTSPCAMAAACAPLTWPGGGGGTIIGSATAIGGGGGALAAGA